MKNLSKIFLLLVLCVSLFAIGCKKAEQAVATDDTAMTDEVATATDTTDVAQTAVAADTTTATVDTTTATV